MHIVGRSRKLAFGPTSYLSRSRGALSPAGPYLLHLAQDAAAKVLNGIMRGWDRRRAPAAAVLPGGRLWRFPFSKRTSLFSSKNKLGDGGGRDGGRFRGRRFGAIGLPTYIILEPNTLLSRPPDRRQKARASPITRVPAFAVFVEAA